MLLDIEEKFIRDYIKLSRQERLLSELKSVKKRQKAIFRFCHDVDSLIKDENIYLKLKKIDEAQIKQILTWEKTYVLSNKYLDGVFMDTDEMLEYIGGEYLSVIVCGREFALIKKEFERGEDILYVLKPTLSIKKD